MTAAPETQAMLVKASAGVGEWRSGFDLPPDQHFQSPIVADEALTSRNAFAVLVRGRGAERIYPPRSILVCLPLNAWNGVLQAGHRIVLQRIQGQVEVTVRELEVQDGRGWLWPRSTVASDPASILPIEMPWPPPERTWRRGEDRFIIAGIVVQALTPELGHSQNECN